MQSVWKYPYALLGIVFILIGVSLLPHHRAIPVLIYHNVTTTIEPGNSYNVETALLSRELDHLISNGYTPLSFSEVAALSNTKHLPDKPIVLTFDDALVADYTQVLPTLRSRGIHATFFITSGLVEKEGYLSWQQVRALSSAGMEIGGHSKTHAHLISLSDEKLTDEIVGDKITIEQEIGKPIAVFAYPFLEHDARTDAVVKNAGYTVVRDDPKQFKGTVMTNSFDVFLKAL